MRNGMQTALFSFVSTLAFPLSLHLCIIKTWRCDDPYVASGRVIESADLLDEVACELVRIKQKFNIEIYFKAFFEK